jgi:hypothetical protein
MYKGHVDRLLASAGCHVLRLLAQHPTLVTDPVALRDIVTLAIATHKAPATVRLYGSDVLLALDRHASQVAVVSMLAPAPAVVSAPVQDPDPQQSDVDPDPANSKAKPKRKDKKGK